MPAATSQTSPDERRRAIRRLLEAHRVQSQGELLELLASEGYETTQPVLSRDLRRLQAVKRDGVYQLLREGERITPLEQLSTLLRDVRAAGDHMVVVVTEPGAASAIARALEGEGITGLVGTIAGDDTVFAAVATPEASRELRERVRSLVP